MDNIIIHKNKEESENEHYTVIIHGEAYSMGVGGANVYHISKSKFGLHNLGEQLNIFEAPKAILLECLKILSEEVRRLERMVDIYQ